MVDRDAAFVAALIEETARKSSLIWLRPLPDGRSSPAWHVVVEGAVHLVAGGAEQELAGVEDGAEVEVTVRSKDTGGRVLRLVAAVVRVTPEDPAWDVVVPELHAKRLNASDGEEQPRRWARESRVLRLEPTGRVLEQPGHLSHRSHAAEPPGSPATTRGPLPFVIGRRARRRR